MIDERAFRATAEKLGVTDPDLLEALKFYCEVETDGRTEHKCS